MAEADDQVAWVAQRRAAAEHHAAAARRASDAEAAKAQVLLDQFVRDVVAAGIAPVVLRAKVFGRASRTYRTDRRGWYLRRDHSIGVDVDGAYLVLTVPASLGGLLRGTTVVASPPPLVVGAGGKDGDAIDLADLLARRLAAGAEF